MAKSIHNWMIYLLHDRALREQAERHFRGHLLDLGCGTKPYQSLLRPFIEKHIGLDRPSPFNSASKPDVAASVESLPFPDNTFDSALSTFALEHLKEPAKALRETRRVLRPGGTLILSLPLIWQVHAKPWDYFRFTNFGIEFLCDEAGLEIVDILPLSGFWVTFGQMLCYYLIRFCRGPIKYLLIIQLCTVAIQLICLTLDKIDKAEDWTWAYMVVARKPKAAAAT